MECIVSIYINRILNMKYIKAIGLDMDHTLVRYYSDKFEELTFNIAIKKLINDYGYPSDIEAFTFNFYDAIRGLVIDRENGNILKVSVHSKIKSAYHGTKELTYRDQLKIYKGMNVDLRDANFTPIDTTFSIAFTIIYAQMVDLKDNNPDIELPSYHEMSNDIVNAVDIAHRDGSLKDEVKNNLEKYIIRDEKVVEVLERFKKYGKKLWIITNSDYDYSRALLDYTINPYLKDHKHWSELFDLTITLAFKPRFFTDKTPFLKIEPESGMMENFDEKVSGGIFQGGWATKIQNDYGLAADEILYLGDHIYGDIVRLKKACGWRTALVVEEMSKEVVAYKNTKKISVAIDELMTQKVALEKEIDNLYAKEHEHGEKVEKSEVNEKFNQMEKIDKEIGKNIKEYESHFNPRWGEVMRAGMDPSQLAGQVERYACIYMSKVSDFSEYSPRTYFRPAKKKLSHEV
jgi:HAD superfamily 5'-nucleotidase-like hydrolase